MSLSLPPRFDLFEFSLPKDFLPEEIAAKYQLFLNKNAAVITTPIDYLNESITGISLPGLRDLVIQQPQVSFNDITQHNKTTNSLGRINIEPHHDNTYKTPANILSNIDKELKVSFRLNQGLLNYFMMYETTLYHMCKPIDYKDGMEVFQIFVMNEEGVPMSKIVMEQMLVTGIDGLEFNYSKFERAAEEFEVTFSFNNINFQFINNITEY